MMVPRSFLFSSASPKAPASQAAKRIQADDARPSQDMSGSSPLSTVDPRHTHTSPVVVPSKRNPRATAIRHQSLGNGKQTLRGSRNMYRRSSAAQNDRPLPDSITSILEATAIPVPRRISAGSRRLPRDISSGDFSKLLMDGINLRDDQLVTDGPSNTALDILLSPPEEDDESSLGCDAMTPPASLQSVSSESIPSLEHDLDSQSSVSLSSPSYGQRSHPERRARWPSPSENCVLDHPLLEVESPIAQPDVATLDPTGLRNPRESSSSVQSFPRLGSTFKSNLTASLRAIKSAAQTVSAFAAPPIQQDDFLTRSLFTVSPKLTDDRRPAPMEEPPCPALRRYLNPITVSPAEIHIYHERPPECSERGSKCLASIQMQTYHGSGMHSRRKGDFHFSAVDDLPYDPEMVPMARQREPRENSDFLRVAVLEMNMKRSGKLRDDIPTRARIWLPPRKGGPHRLIAFGHCSYGGIAVPTRWVGVSIAYP